MDHQLGNSQRPAASSLRSSGCSDGLEAMGDGAAAAPRAEEPCEQMLIREVRHRLANNLQIVGSALLLSARATRSKAARRDMAAAYNRIMAVAALDRRLSDVSRDAVDLAEYLTELGETLSHAVIVDPEQVVLSTQADNAVVAAQTARSLGMIVAELVTNAQKYAFPDRRPGVVDVTFHSLDRGWVLEVTDNGVGLSGRIEKRGSGAGIVQSLAKQLHAVVEIRDANPGTAISITCADAPVAPTALHSTGAIHRFGHATPGDHCRGAS